MKTGTKIFLRKFTIAKEWVSPGISIENDNKKGMTRERVMPS